MLYFTKHSFYFNLLPPNAYLNFGDSTATVHKILSRHTTAEYLDGADRRSRSEVVGAIGAAAVPSVFCPWLAPLAAGHHADGAVPSLTGALRRSFRRLSAAPLDLLLQKKSGGTMKAYGFQIFIPLILLDLFIAAIPSQIVHADAGPHPSMQFIFISRIKPMPAIISGQLLECEDEACVQSGLLPQLGPQRFECQVDACYSSGYSYSLYHRLIIEFSDGMTRRSNTFTKHAFAANYRVSVLEESLIVEEKPLGPNIPFFQTGAPTLFDFLATFAFPFVEIILSIVLIMLAVRTGRDGATHISYYNWEEAAWLLAIPAILIGIKWTQGLIITLVIELLVGTGYAVWKKRSVSIILTVILLLNLITQPVLWITISSLSGLSPIFLVLLFEGAVWLVEAGGLYLSQRNSMNFQEALWVSLALNAASFVVGNLLPL